MENNGKYTGLCEELRDRTASDGAVVMIYNGKHGNGFSIVGAPEFHAAMPFVLRYMADKLEANAALHREQLC